MELYVHNKWSSFIIQEEQCVHMLKRQLADSCQKIECLS